MTRAYLTSDLDLYVSTSGSDTTGDGSAGNPWRTGTHAYEAIRDTLDLGGRFVTVHFAPGAYGGNYCEGPVVGGRGAQSVTFVGSAANQGCIISAPGVACLSSRWGAEVSIKNFTCTGGAILNADEGKIAYSSINFSGSSGAHINASGAQSVVTSMDSGSWQSAGGTFHAVAENLAQINEADHYMTLGVPGIGFSIAYCQADENGIVNLQNTTWGGYGFTGVRFYALSGGVIEAGKPLNWIPGTLDGNCSAVGVANSSGGVYN